MNLIVNMNIKQRTKIGMFWNTFEKFSVQGVSFVLNIILARLLSPNDYGTIGLLTVFLTFSSIFVDGGFFKGIIQKQDREEIDFSTTFIFNFIISIVLYIILFFCAPAIALFFNNPDLVLLSRVLFVVVILNSLTVIQSAKLQLAVNYKLIAIINFTSIVLSGVLGIVAAYKGFGVWSLVMQTISRNGLLVLLYWRFGHWFPRTGFSILSFKKLFGYGSNLLLSSLIATSIANIQNLLVGKIYAPSSLGYYSRAQQFPEMTSGTVSSVLNTVTFPLMASLQDNKNELLFTYKRLIKMTCIVIFPAMIGLALISKTIVVVLLTEKWLNSTDFLFWLALSYVFFPLSILNLNILNAIGRSDLNLKFDLLKVPLIILSLVITIPISLTAIVIGKAILSFICYYIDAFMSRKYFHFGAIHQLLYSWKSIFSTIVMAIVIILVNHYMIQESVFKLFVLIFFGVITYTVCLIALREEEIKTMYLSIKGIINKLRRN